MIDCRQKQTGAVSMFAVIFSALLITVVTVGFVSVMMRNQRQATDSDLSQTAYDSAMVGVEDGKRAILRYISCTKDDSQAGCLGVGGVIETMEDPASQKCTNVVSGLEGVNIAAANAEVPITSDTALNQAYTCVKINYSTSNYLNSLGNNETNLIPLIGRSSFNQIKLDWFMKDDLAGGFTQAGLPDNLDKKLYETTKWKDATSGKPFPPIMRAQFIKYNSSGFSLTDFDNNDNGSRSNTLFLYPTSMPTSLSYDFLLDSHTRNPSDTIFNNVKCSATFAASGYACSTTLNLSESIGANDENAYLNLSSLYNNARYQVTLLNSGSPVDFAGVQSEIDSTGRANDLYRRVKTRVELKNSIGLNPGEAVYSETGLCKTNVYFATVSPTDTVACP